GSDVAGIGSSFFFSSRRRHTRCYRDWSSDVCSSDLPGRAFALLMGLCFWWVVKKYVPWFGIERPARADVKGLLSLSLWYSAGEEIGRASCRERAKIAVVGGMRARSCPRWAEVSQKIL